MSVPRFTAPQEQLKTGREPRLEIDVDILLANLNIKLPEICQCQGAETCHKQEHKGTETVDRMRSYHLNIVSINPKTQHNCFYSPVSTPRQLYPRFEHSTPKFPPNSWLYTTKSIDSYCEQSLHMDQTRHRPYPSTKPR